MVKLTLDVPPSANRYWRNQRGRMVRSTEATAYKTYAGWEVISQSQGFEIIPKPIPVAVTIEWYRKRKSGDLDNRIKILLDSLEGLIYEKDSQIEELHAYRYEDKANPRIIIEITRIEPCRLE